eukprot:Gb_12005 [translate_table: standard]
MLGIQGLRLVNVVSCRILQCSSKAGMMGKLKGLCRIPLPQPQTKQLEGKMVMITGATSDIKERTTRLLEVHGACVLVVDVQDKWGGKVAKAVERAMGISIEKKVDVFHHNSGITWPVSHIDTMPMEEFNYPLGINLRGAMIPPVGNLKSTFGTVAVDIVVEPYNATMSVTIIEIPSLRVVKAVAYLKTPSGLRTLNIVSIQHLSKEVMRQFYKNWYKAKKVAFPKYPRKYELEDDKKVIIGPCSKGRTCQGHIIPRYGRIPLVWVRCGRLLSSIHYPDWPKEWGDGSFIFKQAGLHFPSRRLKRQGRWRAKSFRIVVAWGVGLYVNRFWKRVCRFLNMGGDPVTKEPTVLKIDEDIRSILEEAVLIVEVSGLPNEGEAISRDKTNKGGGPGDEVSHSGRKILKAIWIPHSNLEFHEEQGESEHPPLPAQIHGERKSSTAGPSKGGFVRVSGAPVSKAQLLLGPTSSSPFLISGDMASDFEGDSRSLEGDCPTTNPKENRRSSRLQRKTVEKAKFVDDAESSDEVRKFDDLGSLGGRSNPLKVTVVAPSGKGPAKSSEGSHLLSEELHCHLRVLNGLGGSLTSTCACINLLTLEITNYLKEVVKNMKELNAAKEQHNPLEK